MSDRKDVPITDANGRKIVVRGLTVVEQARMMRAIGPEQSGNREYSSLVQIAAMTREIDGVPMPFPRDDRMIDATLERLDDAGVIAITLWRNAEIEATMKRLEALPEGASPLVPSAPSPNAAP